MKGSLHVAALALISALSGRFLAAQTANSFTLSGVVVESTGNYPLNHILVTISPTEHREQVRSCVTGSDGRFAFENLAAGKYALFAARRNSFPQAYRENESYSTAIAVGPGIDSEHVVFPLAASGSVSGTVFDEDGDPLRQSQVWLFYKGIFSGRPQVTMAGSRMTDSTGTFHFGHLKPGNYLVGVQGRPWYSENLATMAPIGQQRADRAPELDVAYPVTYYADTVDPAAASPIAVAEGSEATIRITLHPAPAIHVQITGFEPKPEGGLSVVAYTAGPGGFSIMTPTSIYASDNGQELTGLAPGRYALTFQTVEQGKQKLLGTQPLDLSGNTSVDLTASTRTSLSGQVRLEGNAHLSDETQLWLVPTSTGNPVQLEFGRDGTLRANDSFVPPGHYRLQLQGAPGLYLKSIGVTGAKFSDGELEISGSANIQLSIAIAAGATSIDGLAVSDGKPFAGAMVLLVPQDRERLDLIRRDQSDSDGTFTLIDAAPGRYTLVAIDNGRNLEYQNADVMKPYLRNGQTVDVPVGNGAPLKVTVQQRRAEAAGHF